MFGARPVVPVYGVPGWTSSTRPTKMKESRFSCVTCDTGTPCECNMSITREFHNKQTTEQLREDEVREEQWRCFKSVRCCWLELSLTLAPLPRSCHKVPAPFRYIHERLMSVLLLLSACQTLLRARATANSFHTYTTSIDFLLSVFAVPNGIRWERTKAK